MVKAKPTIGGRLIALAYPFGRWRAEFAGGLTARFHTGSATIAHASMEALRRPILLFTLVRHVAPRNPKTAYIGRMTNAATGPVATQIAVRLARALEPSLLEIINDSASHAGHMGDDGSGESHFTVVIESAAFAGQSRLARQRLVNQALGDLMEGTVHALVINAKAPAEP